MRIRYFIGIAATVFCSISISVLFASPCGCGNDDSAETDSDSDNDTDTDSDADSDTDADTDTDTDSDDVCIASITGMISYSDGSPVANQEEAIRLCTPNCQSVSTDENGRFLFEFILSEGMECLGFDFSEEYEYIHLTIAPFQDDLVVYSINFEPEQSDITDDWVFDIGTVIVYQLTSDSVEYEASVGASVDLEGLSFEMEPYSLLTTELDTDVGEIVTVPVESATFRVFKTPYEEWTPPFDTEGLDALYFISPYWGLIEEGGVSVSMEPPSNWTDGDTGFMYMLGDFNDGLDELESAFIYQTEQGGDTVCVAEEETNGEENEMVESGHLVTCGTAEYQDGKVVTSPIPRLGWVGIKK